MTAAAAIGRFRTTVSALSAPDRIAGRLARGAAWTLGGTITGQAATLLVSMATARWLGSNEFGQLGVVQTTVGLFGTLAGMGLGLTTTKYVAQFRSTDAERAGRIIALSRMLAAASAVIASLVLVFAAGTIASSTLRSPELASPIRVSAGLLFLNTLFGAQTGVLSGFEAFRSVAVAGIIRAAAALPLSMVLVPAWRVTGGIVALILATLAGCILNSRDIGRLCRRYGIQPALTGAFAESRILWAFSIPALLSGSIVAPANWLVNVLLAREPRGYAEVAVLTIASQWRMALSFLPAVMGQPLVTVLASTKQGGKSHRRTILASVAVAFISASLLAGALVPSRGLIMRSYGDHYADRTAPLVLTILTAVLLAAEIPIGNALAAYGQMWTGASINLIWAAVLILSSMLFLDRGLGAEGIVLAYLIAYAVHAISSCIALFRLFSRNQ